MSCLFLFIFVLLANSTIGARLFQRLGVNFQVSRWQFNRWQTDGLINCRRQLSRFECEGTRERIKLLCVEALGELLDCHQTRVDDFCGHDCLFRCSRWRCGYRCYLDARRVLSYADDEFACRSFVSSYCCF